MAVSIDIKKKLEDQILVQKESKSNSQTQKVKWCFPGELWEAGDKELLGLGSEF